MNSSLTPPRQSRSNRTLRRLVCGLGIGAGLLAAAPRSTAGDGSINKASQTLDLSVVFSFSETEENLNGATNLESWRAVFNDASARLWNATNGQLKIGKVRVYRRAFSKKETADVWVLRGNSAAFSNGVAKLGVPGYRTTMFGERHRSNRSVFRGGFSLVHELSHYVFGLYDEYQGASVPMSLKSSWTPADLSAIQRLPFSVAPTIMTGGGGVGNSVTEFDSPYDVNKGSQVGANWWMTENWIMNGESSWETLGKFEWKGEKVFLKAHNGPADRVLPVGDTSVEWLVMPDVSRLAIVLDRSGSMGGENRMPLAKLGAGFMAGLTVDRHVVTNFVNGFADTDVYPADRLAVIDFDGDVTVTYPLTEVDSAGAVRGSAKAAISLLGPRGSTAIGDGVQKALDVFSDDGEAGAQENIVILSDGQDNSSRISMAQVAQNAVARGTRIFSIALGAGADTSGLLEMANTSGGKFFQATDGLGLLDIYSRIYGELRGGGIMEALGSLLFENSSAETVIPVDALSEEITFSVASPEEGMDAQLVSPSGRKFSQSSSADGVVMQKEPNNTVFRVSRPVAGNWKLSVASPKTNTGATYRYNVMANATSSVVSVAPVVASKTVNYPQPALITCSVTAGTPVAGASVTGQVTGPNGVLGSFTLFDDGASIHGDKTPGDGVYSGYYGGFPANGVYAFNVKVVNVNGRAATGENENSLTAAAPILIKPFTRIGTNTVTVTGVPAVSQTEWLRVDALSITRLSSVASTGTVQLRCTFNTDTSTFVPGQDSLILTLDSSRIVVAGSSMRPTRVPGVYGLSDPSRGLTGTFTTAIGGSSKHELLLSMTGFDARSFDFDAATNVGVSFGSFARTVALSNRADAEGKSAVYVCASNFPTSEVLYVDGLLASISAKQNRSDSLRAVVSYQTQGGGYTPGTDSLSLQVGQFLVTVPPNTLTVGTGINATKAMGTLSVGGGFVAVTVDLQRRIVSLNGTRLNLGATILQTANVTLSAGSFSKSTKITSTATSASGVLSLSY